MAVAALRQPKSEHYEITITRIIGAAAGEVFEAWLRPEHLSRWWGPRDGRRDFSTPHVEVNPMPGGTFRTCIRSPLGDEYWARGVFTVIDPPRYLAFTHGWENELGEVDYERSVSVEYVATGDKTRITFRISGFESLDACDSEIEGWNQCLDRLVQYFDEGPERAASTSHDEAEIRALIDKWSQALEARDLDGLTSGHAPDMVLFDVKPPYQITGLDAYRKVWEESLPCFPAKFRSEHRDLKVVVNGDAAFVHCLHRIQPVGEDHPAGHTWLRVTVGYRRVAGQWQVTHEHVSIPFDPMSGKAVFIEQVA